MKTRFFGVLAGGALGDAMGMPTECWSQEKIRAIYPNGVETLLPSDESDAFGRKLAAGSITDDTINVLMIAEMIKKIMGKYAWKTMLRSWSNGTLIRVFRSSSQVRPHLEH